MSAQRLGIIGPGLIWQKSHRPAILPLEETFEVVAFCASSERLKDKVAQQYPGAPFSTDYLSFVQSPDLDAVLVLTPIALNAPVAMAALDAGKLVFLEKPMARTLEEAEALVGAERAPGRQLMVLEQDGYARHWRIVRDALEAGRIGRVVSYDYVTHSALGPADTATGYAGTAWRKQADFPLGTLFDGGHHNIARLAAIFGAPTSVYATGVNLRPDYGEYHHVLAQFSYASGVRGSMSHASALSDVRNHLEIHGTEGVMSVDREEVTIYRPEGEQELIALPQEVSHETMWRSMAEALTAGRPVDYTAQEALRDLVTLLGIADSIRRGVAVELA
jgi:scyllo-inositol 2-dehydrogenase (NADP+)